MKTKLYLKVTINKPEIKKKKIFKKKIREPKTRMYNSTAQFSIQLY